MPRCEDCFHKNACLSMFEAATGFEFELGEESAGRCDDFIPTDNVVPMKEVERIMKEHIDFRKEEGDARAEIALEQALSEIIELRKKYTEEEECQKK